MRDREQLRALRRELEAQDQGILPMTNALESELEAQGTRPQGHIGVWSNNFLVVDEAAREREERAERADGREGANFVPNPITAGAPYTCINIPDADRRVASVSSISAPDSDI